MTKSSARFRCIRILVFESYVNIIVVSVSNYCKMNLLAGIIFLDCIFQVFCTGNKFAVCTYNYISCFYTSLVSRTVCIYAYYKNTA